MNEPMKILCVDDDHDIRTIAVMALGLDPGMEVRSVGSGIEMLALLRSARWRPDAILLDVDNGPDGLTRRLNDHLYTRPGLQRAMAALRSRGILAIWSAHPDAAFTKRLRDAGFEVSEVVVRARPNGKGARHVIWFAQKPRVIVRG